MKLDGKVAIITGSARGIGAAVAARFAADGAAVVCVDERAAELAETVRTIRDGGGTAEAVVADVSTEEGNARAVELAAARFGGLDVLHANAAIQVMGDLEKTSVADWDRMYSVNVNGVAIGIRAALPHFRAARGGSIIITASLLGMVGDPDLAGYGATKGALRALCRSVATAYGPENIRCNTICPGDVETTLVQEFFAFQQDPEAARALVTERYPLRRFAMPQDVAAVAAFLAGDDAAYLTGIDIPVDGGLLARIY